MVQRLKKRSDTRNRPHKVSELVREAFYVAGISGVRLLDIFDVNKPKRDDARLDDLTSDSSDESFCLLKDRVRNNARRWIR